MTTQASVKHIHNFKIEFNRKTGNQEGTCLCGEVREYVGSGKDSTFVVLKAGSLDYADPEPKVISPASNLLEGEIPTKPKTIRAIAMYYEQNKDRILADMEKLGVTQARKRWAIPPGTWTGLKRRWRIPIETTRNSVKAIAKIRKPKFKKDHDPVPVDAKEPAQPKPVSFFGQDILKELIGYWQEKITNTEGRYSVEGILIFKQTVLCLHKLEEPHEQGAAK